MPREIQEPTLDEYGFDVHPAFGNVVVNRATSMPGAVLFGSDIRHNEVVVLRISTAGRKRSLHSDRSHALKQVIEIQMSLAQWASMVSSFGNGGGTDCTITHRVGEGFIPEIPFAPRMAHSINETRAAADSAYAGIEEAFQAYKKNKTATNLRTLQATIENATANVTFAAEQLTRYTEETVQRARADIEAMVTAHAERLGIDSSEVTAPLALTGDVVVEDV